MSFGGSPQPAKPAAANPVETVLREQGAKLVESQMVAVVPRAAVDKAVAGEKAAALGELCNSTATKIEVHHVDAASLSYVTIGGGTGGAAGQILFDFLHEVTDGEACGVAIRPAAAQLPKLGEATLAEVRAASGARVALQSPLLAIAGDACAARVAALLLLRDAIPAAPAADDPATRPAASVDVYSTSLYAPALAALKAAVAALPAAAQRTRLLVPPPPAAAAAAAADAPRAAFLWFDSASRAAEGAALLRRACDGQQAPYARRLSLGGRPTGATPFGGETNFAVQMVAANIASGGLNVSQHSPADVTAELARALPPLGDADAALLRAACLARLREQAATAGAVGPTALRSVEVALLAVEAAATAARAASSSSPAAAAAHDDSGGERKKRKAPEAATEGASASVPALSFGGGAAAAAAAPRVESPAAAAADAASSSAAGAEAAGGSSSSDDSSSDSEDESERKRKRKEKKERKKEKKRKKEAKKQKRRDRDE